MVFLVGLTGLWHCGACHHEWGRSPFADLVRSAVRACSGTSGRLNWNGSLLMKTHLLAFSFAVAVAALLSACGPSASSSAPSSPAQDSKWQQALIGTWRHHEVDGEEEVDGQTHYLPDGKMTMAGMIKSAGNARQVNGTGTWGVKEGHLHYKVETSSMPDLIPDGFTSADKIISVTDTEFTYIDADSGDTTVETRVK